MSAVRAAAGAPAGSWRQVPRAPDASPSTSLLTEALAILIACAGPLTRIFSINVAPRTYLVTAIAVVSTVAMGRLPDQAWRARLAVSLVAGVVAVAPGGSAIGPWLAGALVLADWSVRGRPPLPFLPSSHPGTLPGVVALTALAAWRGRAPLATVAPLVLTALALALTLASPLLGGRLTRITEPVGRVAGRAASRVAFLLLGVPLVLAPWLADRIVRVDRLAAPVGAGSRWVPLIHRDPWPSHPWRGDAARTQRPVWSRWRGALALPLLVALVVVLTIGPAEIRPESAPRFAAFAGDRWWPAYWRELSWWNAEGLDRQRHPMMLDTHGRYIDIVGGDRTSWEPPPCACRRLTVWVYGGSAVFGFGQRDDWTIPSDLARIAWQHGITLDVVNRGVPADLHWMEAQRFEWDAVAGPRPDLVLFYDGFNDLVVSQTHNAQGRGDDAGLDDVLAPTPVPLPSPGPDGAKFLAPRANGRLGLHALARAAVRRYERTRTISRDVAATNHLPIMWFWQPTEYSRPTIPSEPHDRPVDAASNRIYFDAAPPLLAKDVIDLSDAFAGLTVPLFWDEVHTNELGARLVAADMFSHIRPELDALLGRPESPAA